MKSKQIYPALRERYLYSDSGGSLLAEMIRSVSSNIWEINVIDSSNGFYPEGKDEFYIDVGTWKLLPNQDKPL